MSVLDVCSNLCLQGFQPVPFIGKGNVWIDNIYDPRVIDTARTILSKAIFETAPGQLSILAYDQDLSGVFAPFSALSSGEGRILEFIEDEKSLEKKLNDLKVQIQAVQNVIQGREATLIDFRKKLNQPIEGYTLVVISADLGLISLQLMNQLSRLMRSGPAFGISFLIISTTYLTLQTSSGKEIERKISTISPNITVINPELTRQAIPGEAIISQSESFVRKIQNAKLPTVKFEKLHGSESLWGRSSARGLTFCVGTYGLNPMEITIGDEINQRHNVVITGAVGQGKSNLISVIIHSLCLRYSPKELQLYLLDFKEGVTFKPFSNIGKPDYLPHARTLGLESDVSFGEAVLESLFQEYQRRMKVLKQENMKSLQELRVAFPSMEMPRVVVVIDEFQMMFGDDLQTGQKIADQLEKSVRLFRAAGIHFILASQTLSDSRALATNKDSIFSQIPIRIALKNSEREAREILSHNNPAAAYVRPRESVVNLDYGEISQNRKTIIAFADESILQPLRYEMWKLARTYSEAPYVFESERRITISQAIENLRQMSGHTAAAGDRISIDGQRILLPMPHEPGRNIAILGACDADCNQAVGIIQSAAISLAASHPDGDARFLFCDFSLNGRDYEREYPHFACIMENLGFFIETIDRSEFSQVVETLLDEDTDEAVYLFGAGMDRWEFEPDPFNQASILKTLAEKGPARGVHFIGWWIKASKFTAQTAGFGNTDAFNSKIFLRIDERTVQSLTSPFIRWTSQTNRGLIIDEVEFSKEMTFIPYAPVTLEDIHAFASEDWN